PPSPGSATASTNGPCARPHQLLHTKNTKAVSPGFKISAPLPSGVAVGVPSPTAPLLNGRLATGSRLPLASTTWMPGRPSNAQEVALALVKLTPPAIEPVAHWYPATAFKSSAT